MHTNICPCPKSPSHVGFYIPAPWFAYGSQESNRRGFRQRRDTPKWIWLVVLSRAHLEKSWSESHWVSDDIPKKRNGQSNYHPFHGLKPPEIKVAMEKSQEIPMKVDDLGVSICSATSRSSLPADLPRTGPSRECPECLKAGTWEVLHLRSSTPKKELWGPFLY